jgi:hypothetical protein
MTALVLWLNIPLAVLAFGLWTGIPLWMVLRHPDRNPAETDSVPAYLVRRSDVRTDVRTEGRTGVRVGARRPRPVRVMVPQH